ncbi:TPA: helix-turn-helix domain-containing protein [Citrobacter koseri]|nr:helix-turn-helix domain-containing protein [Citrobacter koseri]
MTAVAAVNKSGFVMLENDLLNLEKVAGKTFTGNMKITYSLIQGFEKNGQIAYFSRATLERYLGASRSTVKRLVNEMVEIGLIQKVERKQGETIEWRTCPITPEMLGTVEVQESNHTSEAVEVPTVAEIKPIEEAEAPAPAAAITLLNVYSGKVEKVDPQPGELVPVVTPYPRGEVKEPSREWDLDPAF